MILLVILSWPLHKRCLTKALSKKEANKPGNAHSDALSLLSNDCDSSSSQRRVPSKLSVARSACILQNYLKGAFETGAVKYDVDPIPACPRFQLRSTAGRPLLLRRLLAGAHLQHVVCSKVLGNTEPVAIRIYHAHFLSSEGSCAHQGDESCITHLLSSCPHDEHLLATLTTDRSPC